MEIDMDDADRADREGIADVRRKNNDLPPVGFCYYCSGAVPAGRSFCDVDCWDEYETEQRLKAR